MGKYLPEYDVDQSNANILIQLIGLLSSKTHLKDSKNENNTNRLLQKKSFCYILFTKRFYLIAKVSNNIVLKSHY